MLNETVHQATLRVARDLAGGVSYLSRIIGIGVNALDAMLQGREEIPPWVFLKATDFVIEARDDPDYIPPGFPSSWRNQLPGADSQL